VAEGHEWPVGLRPIRWKTLDESKVEQLSPFRRFRNLDREARRGINISVHRRTPELFDLFFFLRSSGPIPRAFPLRVEISEVEIAGYLARTRSALRLLTDAYEAPKSDNYSVDKFLDDMSLIGSELWTKLFGSDMGQRLVSTLNREFARPGTIIQVWTDTDALQFVLPWPWLYPLPVVAGKFQQTDIQQFWGYRYVLEQLRQLTNDKRPTSVFTGEPLRMAAAIHNFIPAEAQRRFFLEFSAKYSQRLDWAEVKPADWRQFLLKCDAHLLYFYCHGHTEQPLDPGDAEMLRTWQRLAITSPSQLAASIESISAEQRQRVRGQSAIAIEKEILNMADLGQFKTSAPNLMPVVFLNMCESSDYYPGTTDNLVDVFLRRGARGVIGTEVPVLPAFGDSFARGFFEAFFTAGSAGEGKEIGTVLWQLRRSFLDQGNPLAFIYTYFGDATTRMKPAIVDTAVTTGITA
jgi:CHAT domain